MAELTFDQLADRVAQGKLGGNYFLKTEEPFLREEAIALLAQAHLEGGSADFDLDQISGEDADPALLSSLIETPPLLSSYRVIVVRDAQGLTPSGRAVVEKALGQEVNGRAMILAAQIPRRSKAKFFDVLRRRCTTVALRTPRPSELPGWVAQRARTVHGAELDMQAAQLLAGGIGPRLGVLAQELDKLVMYAAPSKEIGVEAVRACVGALPQVDRWRWIDEVVERRIGWALNELPALLDSGEGAVGLIAALGEALIRVGLAGVGEATLVQVLKRDGAYHNLSWKVRTYVQQARRWPAAEIDRALEELLRADRLIKSGGLSDRAAIEEALLRIGTGNGDGPGAAAPRSGRKGGTTGARRD